MAVACHGILAASLFAEQCLEFIEETRFADLCLKQCDGCQPCAHIWQALSTSEKDMRQHKMLPKPKWPTVDVDGPS